MAEAAGRAFAGFQSRRSHRGGAGRQAEEHRPADVARRIERRHANRRSPNCTAIPAARMVGLTGGPAAANRRWSGRSPRSFAERPHGRHRRRRSFQSVFRWRHSRRSYPHARTVGGSRRVHPQHGNAARSAGLPAPPSTSSTCSMSRGSTSFSSRRLGSDRTKSTSSRQRTPSSSSRRPASATRSRRSKRVVLEIADIHVVSK